MKEDINFPEVKDIAIAIVKELNEEKTHEVYNVYFLNLKDTPVEGVLVVSKGYGKHPDNDETIKTSVLRHSLGTVEPKSFVKVEQIMENVFGLNNEYWVSYFENKQMHDKKYVFLPETILENNFVDIPLINKKGVIIR
jgi:hypothetical protein